jgi:DNA mismatch repair protein MutS2
MLRRKYEKELESLEALRREAKDRLTADSRQLFRRAQDRLDNTLAELRNATSEGRQTERARAKVKEIESELQNAIEQQVTVEQEAVHDIEPSRPLRTGDQVRIPSLGVTGEVLEDERGLSIPVQVGAIRMNVPVATVRLIGDGKDASKKKTRAEVRVAAPVDEIEESPIPVTFSSSIQSNAGSDGGDMVQRALAGTSQITLLGQRADEAIRNVDKYIDDSYAAGLLRMRIVHGKGTGALRRAIQDYLAHNSLVTAYATANADEGGAGVTIVELRAN